MQDEAVTSAPEAPAVKEVEAPETPKATTRAPRKPKLTPAQRIREAEKAKQEALDEMNKEAAESQANTVSLHVSNLVARGMSLADAKKQAG